MISGKVQIPVSQVKFGMFVCELDRHWLGTPFPFQGFRVQKAEEIEKLRKFCKDVWVDLEKSVTVGHSEPSSTALPRKVPRIVYKMSAAFESELVNANEIRETTRRAVDTLFQDVARKQRIDFRTIRRIVHETADGVLRNPDAHLCITHLKKRDEYTAQHSINVSILAMVFGRHLGLPREQLETLGIGGLLHDLGKLRTPLEILNKPGKLTPQEFETVKVHPIDGHQILRHEYRLPARIAEAALSHHERYDGSGYPQGLRFDAIPLWGRIIAIADVYDAITSDRAYHNGLSPTEALTKMYGWRRTQFDAELLEQFIQSIGIYPVGTLVELSTGEVGMVVSVNRERRLKPKVKILLDRCKRPLSAPRTLDLHKDVDADADSPYLITTALVPNAYGIDLRRHLSGEVG
jgi:putative nucleotidyltransferase with HDIG domain